MKSIWHSLIFLLLAFSAKAQIYSATDLNVTRSFKPPLYKDTLTANIGGAAKAAAYITTYEGGDITWRRTKDNLVWQVVGDRNSVISGGSYFNGQPTVSWNGTGFEYTVIVPDYYINGVHFPAKTSTVTLADPNETYNRYDAFVADTNNAIVAVQGTAEESPKTPPIDGLSSLLISNVFMRTGDTVPSVSRNIVYAEGMEWDTIANNGGPFPTYDIDWQSTEQQYSGLYSIELQSSTTRSDFTFQYGDKLNSADFKVLKFKIKLKNANSFNGKFLWVIMGNDNVSVKGFWQVKPGYFGMTATTNWQEVVLPITGDNVQFNKITFVSPGGLSASHGYYIDDIELQDAQSPTVGGKLVAGNGIDPDSLNVNRIAWASRLVSDVNVYRYGASSQTGVLRHGIANTGLAQLSLEGYGPSAGSGVTVNHLSAGLWSYGAGSKTTSINSLNDGTIVLSATDSIRFVNATSSAYGPYVTELDDYDAFYVNKYTGTAVRGPAGVGGGGGSYTAGNGIKESALLYSNLIRLADTLSSNTALSIFGGGNMAQINIGIQYGTEPYFQGRVDKPGTTHFDYVSINPGSAQLASGRTSTSAIAAFNAQTGTASIQASDSLKLLGSSGVYQPSTGSLTKYDVAVIDKTSGAVVKAATSLFGGFIEITKDAADDSITANSLSVGATYKITDRGDRGIFLIAISDHEFSRQGLRKMLCPAYYGVGSFGGEEWIGVWNSTNDPDVDDLTIWGGLVWKSLTGSVGTATDNFSLDGTNWVVIPKASFSNNEYIEMEFTVWYDYTNDWIERQSDGKDNVLGADYALAAYLSLTENPVDVSDWNMESSGAHLFYNNHVISVSNNSNVEGIWVNAGGEITANSNAGAIDNNQTAWGITNNSNNGSISFNKTASIGTNTNDGQIYYNQVSDGITENANTGVIINNTATQIFGNTSPATDIRDNYVPGQINGNSNNGSIERNMNTGSVANNSTNGYIRDNKNNGNIESNTQTSGTTNIFKNINNGNISSTGRTTDITDTVVNK
jgi:hypothetical protein